MLQDRRVDRRLPSAVTQRRHRHQQRRQPERRREGNGFVCDVTIGRDARRVRGVGRFFDFDARVCKVDAFYVGMESGVCCCLGGTCWNAGETFVVFES